MQHWTRACDDLKGEHLKDTRQIVNADVVFHLISGDECVNVVRPVPQTYSTL